MQNVVQAGIETQVRVDGSRRDQEVHSELVRFLRFSAQLACLRPLQYYLASFRLPKQPLELMIRLPMVWFLQIFTPFEARRSVRQTIPKTGGCCRGRRIADIHKENMPS